MPVTTGTTTTSNNKTSSNPSGGGPGGGSLQAPSRTAPSTGAGGQGGVSKSPSSSSSSSKTSSSSPSSSSSSKSSTTGSKSTTPSNPTGGSLQAPARTAPSQGLTSTASRSATPSGTQPTRSTPNNPTGGSLQAPARSAPSTSSKPSAKVTDPSRGLTSGPGYDPLGSIRAPTTPRGSASPASGLTFGRGLTPGSGPATPAREPGDIIDRRGMNNYPNDPVTELTKAIDREYEKMERLDRDFFDSLDRTRAATIAGDLRNPQEIRSIAQEIQDRINKSVKEKSAIQERQSILNKTGMSPQAQLESSQGLVAASKATPNVAVGANRQTAAVPSVSKNTPYGYSAPSTQLMGTPARPNPSAQTYDPLSSVRAPAAPSLAREVSDILGQYKLPDRSPVGMDPSIAGRAAQANKNYTTNVGIGGNVSRTYSDPDVPHETFGDTVTRGLQNIKSAIDNGVLSWNGGWPAAADPSMPGRAQAAKTLGEKLAFAGNAAYDKIKAGAGTFIDNLMGNPVGSGVAGAMPVDGSIISNRVIGPQNMSQALTGDYPRYSTDRPGQTPTSMRVSQAAPSMLDASPDQLALDNAISDPTIRTLSSPQGRANFKTAMRDILSPSAPAAPQPTKQFTDRVPQENTPAPASPNLPIDPRVSLPRSNTTPPAQTAQDAKRQKTVEDIKRGRTRGLTPAPEMSPEDILPPDQLSPIGATPGRQIINNALNAKNLKAAIDQARANLMSDIGVERQKARGLGDVAGPQPDAPSRQPTEVDIPYGDPSIAPSQEGNYPPDRNPLQDDGQPDDFGQVKNRFDYERDRVVDGIKDLPGRLADAILNGDLRPYEGVENDKRGTGGLEEARRRQALQNTIASMPADQQAALVTLLMSLIQQQQSGINPQADLVNKTFI